MNDKIEAPAVVVRDAIVIDGSAQAFQGAGIDRVKYEVVARRRYENTMSPFGSGHANENRARAAMLEKPGEVSLDMTAATRDAKTPPVFIDAAYRDRDSDRTARRGADKCNHRFPTNSYTLPAYGFFENKNSTADSF
ncbi:MAG: hypothetical protein E2O52_05095 [Gammaproteobacteria bacterium]|nr:MAG: hypothetical protein E2O52_05095 [Gammaproteobacteria bacterium]